MNTRKLRIAVAQTSPECLLERTAEKMVSYVAEAAGKKCRLVVFPEGCLSSAADDPKRRIDEAVETLRRAAAENDIYILFGLFGKDDGREDGREWAMAVDPRGKMIYKYVKLWIPNGADRAPGLFFVDGVPCAATLCADRWLRGVEELPAFSGAKILFELSGNYADEWVSDLGWFWYVPRALRNDAFVVLANQPVSRPAEEYGGQGIGHGHSVILAPDGFPLAAAGFENDKLIFADLNIADATLEQTKKRSGHPVMSGFWDAGRRILDGEKIVMPPHNTLPCPEAVINVAAFQIAGSRDIDTNADRLIDSIGAAAKHGADIAVFPELTLTGNIREDIEGADAARLNAAIKKISAAAKTAGVTAAFGTPYIEAGRRYNCAYVIGPDGETAARHFELNPSSDGLFERGLSARSMWFYINGVPAVITLGNELLWNELAELASIRGAMLHLHLSRRGNERPGGVLHMRQMFSCLASFKNYTVCVNAAPAGRSSIWNDTGRYDKRKDIGYAGFWPYFPLRMAEAGGGEDTLFAEISIKDRNRHYEKVVSFNAQMDSWYKTGGEAIFSERDRADAAEGPGA